MAVSSEELVRPGPLSPEGGGTAVASPPVGAAAPLAPVKPAPTKGKPHSLPPYKVLLHNDAVNTVEHVIRSIIKLTPLSAEDAVRRTLEADATGLALLLVTHQERAELYQEQFQSVKLTVTIEPDCV